MGKIEIILRGVHHPDLKCALKLAQVGVQFKMGKIAIILRGVHPPDLKCALK
jgi:hypothetical protein